MDPVVTVSENAPEKTKELWSRHGLLTTDRYPDHSLNSLNALINYAAKSYHGQTAFYYPVSHEINADYTSISWDQFHSLTNNVAAKYSDILHQELMKANQNGTQPTVALLGHGNTIEYYTTQMALQKLNVRTLLLAPDNSTESMRSLVERCGPHTVVLESGFELLIDGVRQVRMIEDCQRPTNTDTDDVNVLQFEDGKDPWERQAFIIHSSGSTGPQKPIVHTNRSILTISRMYRLLPDFHIENWLLLFPLYGITGATCILPSGYAYNLPTTFLPPTDLPSPPAILSTLSTLASVQNPIDCIHSTPNHISALYTHIATTTQDFTPLSRLRVVQPGGAPLDSSITTSLVREGVNVKQVYGSTELGPLMRTFPHHAGNTKIEQMRLLWPGNPHLHFEPVSDDAESEEKLFELIVSHGFAPAAVLWGPSSHTALPLTSPFRTNDLFAERGSGYWVLRGRRDDVVSVAGGRTVDAAGIEAAMGEKGLKVLLVCRVGRLGLLVEAEGDWGGENGGEDGEEGLWQAINDVNGTLRDWERVQRDMVRVLERGKSLPVTVKGNVKRREAGRVFEGEIEGLFRGVG